MVGAAVDHQHVVAELGGEVGGLAVRQGEEDDVVACQHVGRGIGQDATGQRDEVRLVLRERGTRVVRGGERTEFDVGVGEQQPEELSSGVSTRACHRHPNRHANDYA